MPTGWFGKISWPVFHHCKSTAIIWLLLSVLYINVAVKNGKVMSPFRIIRQITMLKWNVGMRFIRKYGPRRRRWDCGSQKLDSIVYLWHGNMEIMPAASYVRFADTKIQR